MIPRAGVVAAYDKIWRDLLIAVSGVGFFPEPGREDGSFLAGGHVSEEPIGKVASLFGKQLGMATS
jgi:hypothetical protein